MGSHTAEPAAGVPYASEPTISESTHRGATPENRRPVALRPQPRTISAAELLAIVKKAGVCLAPTSIPVSPATYNIHSNENGF